jgi:hypothetical protein
VAASSHECSTSPAAIVPLRSRPCSALHSQRSK